jgi:hypothetical protein
MSRFAAVSALTAVLAFGGLAVSPAVAHNATQSYFCQLHPNAAQCKKTGTTVVVPKTSSLPKTGFGGTYVSPAPQGVAPAAGSQSVVTSLAGSPRGVSSLPATGGGVPTAPNNGILLLLASLLISLCGGGLKLVTRRT